MRTRRDLLLALGAGGLWLACGAEEDVRVPDVLDGSPPPDGAPAGADAAATPVDAAGCTMTVTLHDLLFIDPLDPQWRVEGATPQTIPAC